MNTLTKKEFKKLHSGGELLLLHAFSRNLDDTVAQVNEKIAQGVNLADYAVNTSRADVDGKSTSIYQDEENSLIYATSAYDSDTYGRTYNTVVYILN